MDEVKLIDMMSYLDPDLLEDDYIENDINKFKKLFNQLTDKDLAMPFNLGVRTLTKVITIFIASILLLIGIVVFIVKKKKGFKLRKKVPRIGKKIYSLATN